MTEKKEGRKEHEEKECTIAAIVVARRKRGTQLEEVDQATDSRCRSTHFSIERDLSES